MHLCLQVQSNLSSDSALLAEHHHYYFLLCVKTEQEPVTIQTGIFSQRSFGTSRKEGKIFQYLYLLLNFHFLHNELKIMSTSELLQQ